MQSYNPFTRLAEVELELAALERQRNERRRELGRLNRTELLALADVEYGQHILRGTSPRNKASARDIIAALVDRELPTRQLERERRQLLAQIQGDQDA